MFSGVPKDLIKCSESLTGKYLKNILINSDLKNRAIKKGYEIKNK
ncbi:hypothetical protein [Oceanotoga teriensis]|nr:hypothetical protein [Oceanotoga teriensis]